MSMLGWNLGVSEIVIAPSSREVQRGGSTYFNCSTSLTSKEIHWFHYPASTTERSFVYGFGQFYSPYLSRFAMDKNATTGEYNIVITSVVAEDAGKYECQDDAGSGMKKAAHLIVLDTDLMCQSNVNVQKVIGPNLCDIEPDQLILTCTVQYHGNEAPILQWELNDYNESITKGITRQIIGNSVIYNLTMTTDQISDGSFYVCRTNRSTSKIVCNSGSIKVVGSRHGISNGDSNCKTDATAIICICIFLLLPLMIGVTVLSVLMLRYKQKEVNEEQELQTRTTQSPDESTKAETGETNQKTTEAADVKKHLLSGRSGESNNGFKSKIKTLENENSALQLRIQRRDQTITEGNQTIKDGNQIISDLRENDELNKVKINNLQLENDQLQAKIKELEQHLYPKESIYYVDKPVLAHTIELSEKSKGKPINGITILGIELFVVNESSQEIEVFDSKTFKYERNWKTVELTNPLDISSSQAINCLYIIDQESIVSESKIIQLDRGGTVLNRWLTGGGRGRLSTYGSNVILCLSDKHLIKEYSSDGVLIVIVPLSPAFNLNNPLHAIKVTSTCFVVSHGDVKDELQRVCVVDLAGNIIKECTKWEKSIVKVTSHATMKVPICLVEDSERSIIVADRDNNRILLLSSLLKYQRKLIETEQLAKGFPVRMCFDDTQTKLFIAVNRSSKKEWDDCRIMIFNIK